MKITEGTMKSIILALLASLLWSSNVSAQTSFFEGKTVRILVGFSPAALTMFGPA